MTIEIILRLPLSEVLEMEMGTFRGVIYLKIQYRSEAYKRRIGFFDKDILPFLDMVTEMAVTGTSKRLTKDRQSRELAVIEIDQESVEEELKQVPDDRDEVFFTAEEFQRLHELRNVIQSLLLLY